MQILLSIIVSLEIPVVIEGQYCYENAIMVNNIKDFGNVSGAAVLKHTYTLVNITDEDIHLRIVRPSCSCTKVSCGAMSIPRHGSLDIVVEYDVDLHKGYFDKSIMILVVGRKKPLILKIRGYVL